MPERFVFQFDPEDFSLDLCVNCGQVFRWKRVEDARWVGSEGEYWFDVTQPQPGKLEVASNGSLFDFERLFRFDWAGPEVRSEMLRLGPELKPYISQLPGLRMMRPTSAVETFFCFLCTPNNHLSRITAMIETLGSFGTPMASNPEALRFPDLAAIASIEEGELRRRGFGYRGATIPRAARELLDLGGEAYLNSLKHTGYPETHSQLCAISGVGPKLADCIALYALDHTESVPIDTHIWQAATRLYFPQWEGSALTALKYREVGDFFRGRFGKLSGWAHQYLFFENVMNWRTRKSVSS
jgi:N-glycosylase/DNA lyase